MSEAQKVTIAMSRTPRAKEVVDLVARETGLPDRAIVVTDWRRSIGDDGQSSVTIEYRLRNYRDGPAPLDVDMAAINAAFSPAGRRKAP